MIKFDGRILGVAAVILMASVGGDFSNIPSPISKIFAYVTVSLAPSLAIHYKKLKREEINLGQFFFDSCVTSILALALALLILYFWLKSL